MNSHMIRRAAGLVALVVLPLVAFASGTDERIPEPRLIFAPNAADGTITGFAAGGSEPQLEVKVGERASHGIATSPDGRIVYAGDAASDTLVVIDSNTARTIDRVSIGHEVHGIDISPDARTLWVGGSVDGDPMLGTLTAIDTASNEVIAVVSPALGSASHFSFTPDGTEIWVASASNNLIWIVATETGSVIATVAAVDPREGPGASDEWGEFLETRNLTGLNEVAVSPDGEWAYAIGPASSRLFKIDVADRVVRDSVQIGERGHGVTVSPGGREVWVADWAGRVHVIDAASLQLLTSIQVAETAGDAIRGANHVAFSRTGSTAYVTSGNRVVAIDTETRTVAGSIQVGTEPHEISLEDHVAPGARIDSASIIDAIVTAGARNRQGSATVIDAAATSLFRDAEAISNNSRSVTVTVTPVPNGLSTGYAEFAVALNTHSVDLDYDLRELSVLRDHRGTEYRAMSWDGPAGGHHVFGYLRFDGVTVDPGERDGFLELSISGVGGEVVRTFRWQM